MHLLNLLNLLTIIMASGNATLLYHLAIGLVDVGVLAVAARFRRVVYPALALMGLIAVFLAGALGEDPFGAMRLLAWGLFLHGFIVLAGSAFLARRRDRTGALVCAGAAIVLELIALDAFVVEPRWLEITTYETTARGIRRPLTLLLLADLQTDRIGSYERRALERAMALRPELILLAGDYVQIADRKQREKVQRELNAYLHELDFGAPSGAFAVAGNSDPPGWEKAFAGLPVTLLETTRTIDLPQLRLTGLSLADSANRRLAIPEAERFHVVLGHSPDFALGNVGADLLVAGHTHGGQVRLPVLGPPLVLSAVPRAWAAGATDLGDGRTLIVSRGLGMEREHAPRLRFLCRPEIVVIRLVPGD